MEHLRTQDDIDAVVARFFSAFDNRTGRQPSIHDVSSCFAERAVVVRHSSTGVQILTVDEFAAPRIDLLCGGELVDFHEWEVSASTQVFAGIAARTSRYSKAGLLNGGAYSGSGTKCFHLARLGNNWLITSLAWVDDGA